VRRTGALWAIAGAFFAGDVSVGTYTWSTGTTGAAQDGSVTWDTTTANWVGVGNAHSVWSNANGDTAVFGAGGTAGTVTVDAGGVTGGVLTLPNATVLEGATLLSGSLAETDLSDAWHFRCDRTAGTVTIYYSPRGTLIKLM
jgi:hypothetical protein